MAEYEEVLVVVSGIGSCIQKRFEVGREAIILIVGVNQQL